jgi:hypothetical protein
VSHADEITYRAVTTRFRALRPNSVLVDAPASFKGATVWLPRSLVHGADDSALERMSAGQEFTFRLMDWKAEEVGWA